MFDIHFTHLDYFTTRIVIETKIEYRVQSENKSEIVKELEV